MKKIIRFYIYLISAIFIPSLLHGQTSLYRIEGQEGLRGNNGINGVDPGIPPNGINGVDGRCLTDDCFKRIIPFADTHIHIQQSFITVSDQTRSLATNSDSAQACIVTTSNIPQCENLSSEDLFIQYMTSFFSSQQTRLNLLFLILKGNASFFLNLPKSSDLKWSDFLIRDYGITDEILEIKNSSTVLLMIHEKNSFAHIFHEDISDFDISGLLFREKSTFGITAIKAERTDRYLNDIERPSSACINGNVMILGSFFWTCRTNDTVKQSHVKPSSISNNLLAINTVSLVDFKPNNGLNQHTSFQNNSLQTNDISTNTFTNNVFEPFAIKTRHFKPLTLKQQDFSINSVASRHITPKNTTDAHLENNSILPVMIATSSIKEPSIATKNILSSFMAHNIVSENHVKKNFLSQKRIVQNDVFIQTHIITSNVVLNIPNNSFDGVVLFQRNTETATFTVNDALVLQNTVLNQLSLTNEALIQCTGCVTSAHIQNKHIAHRHLHSGAKIPSGFCVFTKTSTCPDGFTSPFAHTGNKVFRIINTDNSSVSNTPIPHRSDLIFPHTEHRHHWSTGLSNIIHLIDNNATQQQVLNLGHEDISVRCTKEVTDQQNFTTHGANFYTLPATMPAHTATFTGRMPDKAFGVGVCCKD